MNTDEHRKFKSNWSFVMSVAMSRIRHRAFRFCLFCVHPCSSVSLPFLLASCAIGPNYSRPDVEVPAQWKEAGDWVVAKPSDAAPKGKWWDVFNDPVLNALEEQVNVSNQTLKVSEARYRQAHAAVQAARSGLFPTLGGSAGATRSRDAGRSEEHTSELQSHS